MQEPIWSQPNPQDMQDPSGPPLPDTETLLAELASSYPAVSYPAAQPDDAEPRESVDETIFAGLVWP